MRSALRVHADPARAEHSGRYFQAQPGGYGEGDRFLGVRVPDQRAVARHHGDRLDDGDIVELLHSPWHEERLTALLVLDRWFGRADDQRRAELVALYLQHLDRVDNWDLVDSSAPQLLGRWLADPTRTGPDRSILDELAASPSLWRRRVAVLATQTFIRGGEFEPTLALCECLLDDPHDLIHKATGWMLREIGDRDRETAERFLRRRCRTMPRTMLRYAIEKYPPERRRAFLDGSVTP